MWSQRGPVTRSSFASQNAVDLMQAAREMDIPAPRRAALRRPHAHALHECTPVKSKLTKRMEQIKLRIIRVLQFVY